MCRMLGFVAERELSLEGPLVSASHALRRQASQDRSGRRHLDGWGLGWYPPGAVEPEIVRSPRGAPSDPLLPAKARRRNARLAIAHVRLGSVGSGRIENNHPYASGCWLFAHNGTLQGFDLLEAELRAETSADLRALRRGTNDSELIFLWLVTRLRAELRAAGDDVEDRPLHVARTLGRAVADLADRADRRSREPSAFNLLLSDSRWLWATRYGRTLCRLSSRESPPELTSELFGPGAGAEWNLLTSEPLAAGEASPTGPWREIADRHIIVVGANDIVLEEPLRSLA